MRLRVPITLAAAIGLASVSVHLAREWIAEQAGQGSSKPDHAVAPVPVTKIVVAAEPLSYGSKVVRGKLRLAAWPTDALPNGVFTSLDAVVGSTDSSAENRLVLRSIGRDEPILKHKISGFGARASLSALIAAGQRAATIRVNDVNGVAGFVLPGDRVDVLLTRSAGGGSARRNLVTDVLLQDVNVLGIDQDTNAERDRPAIARAVTLEVTQQEAQKLTLAQKLGTLSLTLRHADAADTVAPLTITASDLPLAGERTAARNDTPEPAAPQHRQANASATPPNRMSISPVRIVRGLDVFVYDVAVESLQSEVKPSVVVEAPVPPRAWMPSTTSPTHGRSARSPMPGARLEAENPFPLASRSPSGTVRSSETSTDENSIDTRPRQVGSR